MVLFSSMVCFRGIARKIFSFQIVAAILFLLNLPLISLMNISIAQMLQNSTVEYFGKVRENYLLVRQSLFWETCHDSADLQDI